MVGENIESCNSQMPTNPSEYSKCVEIKWLIDCYTNLKILTNPDILMQNS